MIKMKMISKLLLGLSLVFVLGSTITQVRGESLENSVDPTSVQGQQLPGITIYSIDNVSRGKTGAFVLKSDASVPGGITPTSGIYANFAVGGTAIPGVDYLLLVSPAYIGQSGYGVILVKTLPDPRGSNIRKAYSIEIKLNSGPGYVIGAPSSATMWIKP
jgi:hypothetical protein